MLPTPPANRQDLAHLTAEQWKGVLAGEPRQAMAWMRAAARLGLADAQAVAGQWMLNGHGCERDPAVALHWFLAAAAQKHAMAANMAGRCYENGWGTPPDLAKAVPLYHQAAELGLDAGMYNYANQLASGKAIAQDHGKALGWYSQAASLGHAKSMTKAGRYFEDGLVVEKNLELAFDSYRQAAEGGDFRGQFCYAGMLAARGCTEEALGWLRKVPATATPKYLAEAGALLVKSPNDAIRAIGTEMLEKARAHPAS
ncbi:MAG: tetratricopeptide repeat protein [Ramlibacter sp.]